MPGVAHDPNVVVGQLKASDSKVLRTSCYVMTLSIRKNDRIRHPRRFSNHRNPAYKLRENTEQLGYHHAVP